MELAALICLVVVGALITRGTYALGYVAGVIYARALVAEANAKFLAKRAKERVDGL
jgi:hypothetical protein